MKLCDKHHPEIAKVPKGEKDITLVEAVELYLIKRSKKARHADSAPYADRWLLKNGSKRQPSLLQWAKENAFRKLSDISSVDVELAQHMGFPERSYSMKIHGAKIKAFFTWAVKFEHLNSNPFDKLDRISVTPVPTLPLEPAELTKILSHANGCGPMWTATMTTAILLMRWSGLAISDASCLRRDRLDKSNRLQTYRKKTGEFVHVLLPAFVAEMLRAQTSVHPDFFFRTNLNSPIPSGKLM